jgi:hypothetical protein
VKQEVDLSSIERPSTSVAVESTLWEPTPTRTFSLTPIWQSHSPTNGSAADSCTDTSSESSVSWLQSNAELGGTYLPPMLASAGTATAATSFAGMNAGVVQCPAPCCSFTAADAAHIGVDVPNEAAANLFDTVGASYAECSTAVYTPTCDSVNVHSLSSTALGTAESMATTASSYRETSTLGLMQTNTPVYTQMDSRLPTAVPSLDHTAVHGYTTNNTTPCPLKRGTIGAVDNPTLGACDAGTTHWPAQSVDNWSFGGDRYTMPYHHSR